MSSAPPPLGLVERALAGTGLNVFGTAPGLIVVASGGRELWRSFRAWADEGDRLSLPHPLDTYVGACLDRADGALAGAGIAFRRLEPTVYFRPVVDFRVLAERAGMGSRGPFGMLIHPVYGAWWAMRGAYLFEDEPPGAAPLETRPCGGCPAPCVAGASPTDIVGATPEVRRRCAVGQEHRYEDEQIAYHYDRARALLRLREEPPCRSPVGSLPPVGTQKRRS